jgi:hypothetical protein
MEVHAHTHTARNKWTHYFWEFFMLFLAVTAGFFVENQREHYIEHQREKQFMVSLVQDLEEDIKILDVHLTQHATRVLQMDTLVSLLKNKPAPGQYNQVYYLGRIASRNDIFNYNTRTIDQMRNSGAFRLVRKLLISNLIMSYYGQIKLLEMLEGIEKKEGEEYRKLAIRVFDPGVFNSMVNPQDSIVRPEGNPPLRNSDLDLLADIAGWVQYMKSSRTGLAMEKRNLKKTAGELILLIKKEYRLE